MQSSPNERKWHTWHNEQDEHSEPSDRKWHTWHNEHDEHHKRNGLSFTLATDCLSPHKITLNAVVAQRTQLAQVAQRAGRTQRAHVFTHFYFFVCATTQCGQSINTASPCWPTYALSAASNQDLTECERANANPSRTLSPFTLSLRSTTYKIPWQSASPPSDGVNMALPWGPSHILTFGPGEGSPLPADSPWRRYPNCARR